MLCCECEHGVEVVFIVADYGGFGTELLQVSHKGEDETIVVVDNEDACHGFLSGGAANG